MEEDGNKLYLKTVRSKLDSDQRIFEEVKDMFQDQDQDLQEGHQ